ncbi:MAG TPA: hypothetical protein PKE12_09245 [Kiritimatiellia bacterium]|nr:hypothetical protein [Kiritimatiellia bacterium]
MTARVLICCLLLAAPPLRAAARMELPARAPLAFDSLSAMFEERLSTQEWRRAEFEFPLEFQLQDGTVLPLRLTLVDLESGEETRLTPAVWFEVENRQRWGGRALEIDWLLIADRETSPVARTTYSIQLKAAAPRFVRLVAGIEMELAGWTWSTAKTPARRLNRTEGEVSDAIPTPLGARGERARVNVVTLTHPDRSITLMEDTREPRLFDIIVHPAEGFAGIHVETALSPHTVQFPGRAVFRFSLASPAPETIPELDAPTVAAPPAMTGDDLFTRIAETPYPLVFVPRMRGTDAVGAPSAWTPIPFTARTEEDPDPIIATERSRPEPDFGDPANFARDARVRITAPTSESGADPELLADGILSHERRDMEPGGWRSTDAEAPHRIHIDFPAPTALQELALHWPVIDGVPRTPRTLRVIGHSAAGTWIAWPERTTEAPATITRIELGSSQLKRLTLEMPAGHGPDDDPNRLWIWELELR